MADSIIDIPITTPELSLAKFTGRKVFYTSTENITKENVIAIVKHFYEQHIEEAYTMNFLYEFDKGNQPILNKKRSDPTKENNIAVINLARIIRKLIQSAFLGEQLQYISKSKEQAQIEALATLKKLYDEEDESEHNLALENDLGIVGVAYEYVERSTDGSPLCFTTLSPLCTRVVYLNGIEKKPAFAFTYYKVKDDKQNDKGLHFYVYTPTKTFEFEVNVNGFLLNELLNEQNKGIKEKPNPTGKLPINEYINNAERMGDFEPAISIFNAINRIYSRRLDNVDDIVDSFLVFVNNNIFEPTYDENGDVTGYDSSRLKAFKENKAIEIKGEQGMPADLKYLVNTLDQQQIQTLVDSLISLAFAVLGAPNAVNSKTQGGGDTGEAVNSREGWRAFEDLLKTKERYFRKSLKQRFKYIKELYKFDNLKSLDASQIDIKFIRTKSLNTQSNAQALSAINSLGKLPPEQIISLSNLVEDPAAEMGKMITKIDEFVNDGTLTKEQGNIIKVLYHFPNIEPNSVFGINNKQGELNDGNGNKVSRVQQTTSKKDGADNKD